MVSSQQLTKLYHHEVVSRRAKEMTNATILRVLFEYDDSSSSANINTAQPYYTSLTSEVVATATVIISSLIFISALVCFIYYIISNKFHEKTDNATEQTCSSAVQDFESERDLVDAVILNSESHDDFIISFDQSGSLSNVGFVSRSYSQSDFQLKFLEIDHPVVEAHSGDYNSMVNFNSDSIDCD